MLAKAISVLLILCVVLYAFNALFPSEQRDTPDFLGSYERFVVWLTEIAGFFDNLRISIVSLLERLVPITETVYSVIEGIANKISDIFDVISEWFGIDTSGDPETLTSSLSHNLVL